MSKDDRRGLRGSWPCAVPLGGVVLLCCAAAGVLLAGCQQRRAAPSRPASPPPPAHYVGNAACAKCHPQEHEWQSASRHAATLRLMDIRTLGKQAPPTGPMPGSDLVLVRQGEGYAATVRGVSGFSFPLDLAFGSGKTGTTYAAVKGGAVLEFRETFFPATRQWRTTPGHERTPGTRPAIPLPPERSLQCLGCHTIHSSTVAVPSAAMLGVGCEACHGPGSAHVAAMQGGSAPLDILRYSERNGRLIDALCARCHRDATSIQPDSPESTQTERFQPYGLSLSRCYRESGGALSCVTCHNPHQNVRTDAAFYERICVRCHSAGSSHATAPAHGKPCPVNPRSGCVTCHMPARRVFPGTTIPTTMADHDIRVFKPGEVDRLERDSRFLAGGFSNLGSGL